MHILDSTNFKREVLDIEKPTMVAFTAPWCGHCQKLVPDYTRVAAQLDGVVKMASIDCDDEQNKPTCGRYGIQGFPTLKLFPPTKKRLPKDYQGPRAAKDIAAYMVDALPMGAKKLRAEELQEWADAAERTPKVVLFSKKPTSSPLYKSLALDFRKSLAFAFLRGDQRPVQAAARVHLGVDVSDDKLPLLTLTRLIEVQVLSTHPLSSERCFFFALAIYNHQSLAGIIDHVSNCYSLQFSNQGSIRRLSRVKTQQS